MNNNGRKVVDLCAKREVCMGNTYFKFKYIHKYTRVARDRDGKEVMIDLVLVKRDIWKYVRYEQISDHSVVLCKIEL